jgi:hypothetical protein
MSILARLIGRELARRSAPLGDAQVVIWRDSDEQAAADIEAAKATGRIGPSTEVIVVGWQSCVDAAEARPSTDHRQIPARRLRPGGKMSFSAFGPLKNVCRFDMLAQCEALAARKDPVRKSDPSSPLTIPNQRNEGLPQ